MDIFTEQLAKRPLRKLDYMLFFVVVAIIILEIFFGVFFFRTGFFSLFIVAISIYFGAKLVNSRFVEFEYIVTNGNITIDKIIAKKSRKNVFSFELSDVYEFVKYKKDTKLPDLKRMYDLQTTGDAWCACFSDREFGRVGIVFSPTEKTEKKTKTEQKIEKKDKKK